jgi:SpoIID/LytB domain protein
LTVGLLGLPVPAAQAQTTDPTFTVTGSGWGHMVGMSQYGARAMAANGYSATGITGFYYAGTTVRQTSEVVSNFMVTDPDPLWIGLLQNRANFIFRVDGPGPVGLCKANDGEGECPTQFAVGGETWEFRALGGGACQFFKAGVAVGNPGTCRGALTWDFATGTRVFSSDTGRSYARGIIRFRPAGTGFHVVLEIGMEAYLYGLGEMPSSWASAALEAQAIAARTYATRQALRYGPEEFFDATRQSTCWCQLFSTVADQAYVGWGKEIETSGSRWVDAVNATAGQVITHPAAPDSTVIVAYYASSTGGHTDSNVEGLGHSVPLPYLVPTSDPWSISAAAANPFATWTRTLTGSEIATAFGLDTVTGVEVTKRNLSGTVAEVTIAGTLGGQTTLLVKGGRAFRDAFTMRSTAYSITGGSGIGTAICDGVPPPSPFTDVSAASVHYEGINCLAALEITTGTTPTTFAPTLSVTRWQMAVFLMRTAAVLGVAIPAPLPQGFTDLGGQAQSTIDAINQLKQLGITSGTTPTTFAPNDTVSRWQMAHFLTRLFGVAGGAVPSGTATFGDLAGLSPDTVLAIGQLADLGITTGVAAGAYGPNQVVTREQMATFLTRLIRLL